jgi:superfamily II DNA or RNA helicase
MAVLVNTNQFYDRLFAPDDFTIRRVGFNADGERFRLAALAERIRAAAQYDPHFAVSASKIDPLPHQLDAVYNHLLRSPRIRFLLADDPGAGKTIMAGLLLKELQYRGVVERALIVTPANLTLQWQDELRDKFDEDFTVIRGEHLRGRPGPDLWRQHPHAIISVDLAKREEVRDTFEGVHWDLVVVDEAHKMAAHKYGQKIDKTQAYQLGEVLSERTDNLLLMTATPHRGSPDNFRLLLSLLDQDLFDSNNDNLAEILRQTDMPIFLRRLKEGMRHFDGKDIFPPRNVDTVAYELAGIEHDLYMRVTEYVAQRYQRAEQITDDRTRRNVGLALAVLQRRLASSLRAIRASLERREQKLVDQLNSLRENPGAPRPAALLAVAVPYLEEEPDEEVERWEEEERALGVIPNALSARQMELEIEEVHGLYELALEAEWQAESSDAERKLSELRRVLRRPLIDGKDFFELDEKLLIFTENKDTLDYLAERMRGWGFTTAEIYGGMNQDKRREEVEKFRKPSEEGGAQVMVATEAAGEGINLQFCRLMVNYDIPWNPNRLEQRMGRIHRYGQEHSVQIFNLVAANTREGQVLERILDKLERMRRDLGRENVYDIIRDLLSANDLSELVQKAITQRQSLADIQAAVERTVDANEQKRQIAAALVEALATDQMSDDALNEIRDQVRTANEQRLVPEYIERFVVSAFRALVGDNGYRADIRPRPLDPGVWQIENVPYFIRSAAPAGHSIKPTYTHIIFSKDLRKKYPRAAFVAPGHPLFEALLKLVRGTYSAALTSGARFSAPESERGLFWLLDASVRDGTGEVAGRQLMGVHQRPDGSLSPLDPLALLDVEPLPQAAAGDSDGQAEPPLDDPLSALATNPGGVERWTWETVLEPYVRELRERRAHEANVREDYLQRSLNALIAEQTAKILDYQFNPKAQRDGEFDIGLRTLEQRLDQLKTRLAERMEESGKRRSLGADPPRVVGVCAWVESPLATGGEDEEDTDPDTEAVSMEVAMRYERDHGRTPQDVGSSNLGYDVRSLGPGELRYIEVKGRKGSGAVMLTSNEWIKAARFGREYWLYVVLDCATPHPRLIRIQDPAKNLTVDENVFQSARFRVNLGELLRAGQVTH